MKNAVTAPVNASARTGISARRSAHGTYVHTTVQTIMRTTKSHSAGSGTPSVASRVRPSSPTARITASTVASHRHADAQPGPRDVPHLGVHALQGPRVGRRAEERDEEAEHADAAAHRGVRRDAAGDGVAGGVREPHGVGHERAEARLGRAGGPPSRSSPARSRRTPAPRASSRGRTARWRRSRRSCAAPGGPAGCGGSAPRSAGRAARARSTVVVTAAGRPGTRGPRRRTCRGPARGTARGRARRRGSRRT